MELLQLILERYLLSSIVLPFVFLLPEAYFRYTLQRHYGPATDLFLSYRHITFKRHHASQLKNSYWRNELLFVLLIAFLMLSIYHGPFSTLKVYGAYLLVLMPFSNALFDFFYAYYFSRKTAQQITAMKPSAILNHLEKRLRWSEVFLLILLTAIPFSSKVAFAWAAVMLGFVVTQFGNIRSFRRILKNNS